MAVCYELRREWLPARLEQVYQRDRHTLALALRNFKQRGWLTVCWHPQAARLCLGDAPPRSPDTFTFSQQLQHQLGGLALVNLVAIAPWERVLDLQFARRPGDEVCWHLYVEVMGKYSNVILVTQENVIVTAAHQVSAQQSSVRPVQTGEVYEVPPPLTQAIPTLEESQEYWQERLMVVPGPLGRTLRKTYRGLSPALVESMLEQVGLEDDLSVLTLTSQQWESLFSLWLDWLRAIAQFQSADNGDDSRDDSKMDYLRPGWRPLGYTVLGWGVVGSGEPVGSVQTLLNTYYRDQLNHQVFHQLRHQLSQKVLGVMGRVRTKRDLFQERLEQSADADRYRLQADLLMAYLQEWQPGLTTLSLPDFTTQSPVAIALSPEKNAIQNAQSLYKRHQKLKRARMAVEPLLQVTQEELDYLEQVAVNLSQLQDYQQVEDLWTLEEIRDELVQQGYVEVPLYGKQIHGKQMHDKQANSKQANSKQANGKRGEGKRSGGRGDRPQEMSSHPHQFQTPGGFDVLVGRNNRQNDHLTFRVAGDYDLWFHTQEIPGSHVLLRLDAGSVPDEGDLQYVADLAAYFSQARHGEQVPVIYTEPRNVYKPKGAKPGIAIYKRERVLWGKPQRIRNSLMDSTV